MSSLFFFRQDRGYEEREKLKRVKHYKFTLENPVISRFAEEAGIPDEELSSEGKWDMVSHLRRELSEDRFDEFVEALFEEHGESGDTFNVKLWDVTDGELDSESILEKANELTDEYLPDADDSRSYEKRIYLRKVESREEGVVDLRFEKVGKQEDMSDEIGFETSEGKVFSFSELIHSYEDAVDPESEEDLEVNPEEIERAVKEEMKKVEARVFPDDGLAVMSNSGVTKGLHTEILSIIRKWGDDSE